MAKVVAETLNNLKSKMDQIKTELECRKTEREALKSKGIVAQQVIIDEEEYKMIQSLKALKPEYQKSYSDLKSIRSEIDYCSHLVDQCRQKFMTEFEEWYESIYGGGQSYAQTILNSQGEDVLDIGEKFDRLQLERMSAEDPDSLAYYNAKKNTQRRNQRKLPIGRNRSIVA
jgi:kinesin family protein 6/9